MSSPGDFTTEGTLSPYVKDAYISWKKSINTITFGIHPTPTWGSIEKIWGYRSLEKTPLDLQKFGGSRDFGISIKGDIEDLKYQLMLANGEGYKAEVNKGKKAYALVGYQLPGNLYVELYGDYEAVSKDEDTYVLQGFLSYSGSSARSGIQYAQITHGKSGKKSTYHILSLFGIVKFGSSIDAIARYDRMSDPNPNGEQISYIPFDGTAPSNLIIAGLSWALQKEVKLIPNVEYVFYGERGGKRPDPDLYARITLFYEF